MSEAFTALLVEETAAKQFSRRLVRRQVADLPAGDLLIKVHYSSLNYKDALSATGNKGVTRNFPHTPGIDAAGEVVEDAGDHFKTGDHVVVTGWDLGMNTAGGFGRFIRVPAAWALPLPAGLSLKESMALGTAGFTAALSVLKLQRAGVRPEDGEVLVTGATGGVGSLAVAILARAGYRVVAATGKTDAAEFLRQLGAAAVIGREEALAGGDRPLAKERWAGAVDCVGGDMLAAALKATRYGGAVTCCGLVGSADLNVNVFPFILRGVSLLGIDSVQCPMDTRRQVWNLLAGDWKPARLAQAVDECSLADLESRIQAMLKGELRGRTVVNLADA
ncbi:MAG: YhdH/YhfP family quinone oxidoreductase [Desulfuromonadales bacterium]